METKTFEVDVNVLQATIDYLATRPFREVNVLLQALTKSTPASVKTETKKDKKE